MMVVKMVLHSAASKVDCLVGETALKWVVPKVASKGASMETISVGWSELQSGNIQDYRLVVLLELQTADSMAE
jgi:hypothetical protein